MWKRDWTVLITMVAWAMVGLGVVRMFGAVAWKEQMDAVSRGGESVVVMALEVLLIVVGVVIGVASFRN